MKSISKSIRCPGCKKRASLKEHQGVMDTFERYAVCTWQCIYCGSVCEPIGVRSMEVIGVEQIILEPGELESLRSDRGKSNGQSGAVKEGIAI